MSERVIIVTGASSGLGLWTARHLAPHGDRLALVCRDATRAESARRFVEAAAPGRVQVDTWQADLASIASVRRAAGEMRKAYASVDVLVNNAGAVFGPHRVSSDGIEMHLATNYAGHFVLTALLLERLAASGRPRVLNLTSFLHAYGRMRLDDLAFSRWYHVVPAYAQSKLALVLFTLELAKRTLHLPVGVNCVDPGLVRTEIADGAGPIQRQFARPMLWFAREPREGAKAVASLAVDPTFRETTGAYFLRTREKRPGRRARDPILASRLWERSCEWLEPDERASLDAILGS